LWEGRRAMLISGYALLIEEACHREVEALPVLEECALFKHNCKNALRFGAASSQVLEYLRELQMEGERGWGRKKGGEGRENHVCALWTGLKTNVIQELPEACRHPFCKHVIDREPFGQDCCWKSELRAFVESVLACFLITHLVTVDPTR